MTVKQHKFEQLRDQPSPHRHFGGKWRPPAALAARPMRRFTDVAAMAAMSTCLNVSPMLNPAYFTLAAKELINATSSSFMHALMFTTPVFKIP
ncbi:hypothetical protein GCM10027277_04290 [Pseudoduganella ginsengisoli]|uniref:Uncharacterized protein n=1 Tax=Pseudoduganella ginsengisoli TaxID=1462440 RepID=A0A6L6Q628_9BURK|nr:hypothetical protein [Pseudoduganella ginsengisoli]MTW04864.1 hypothetical protein [Pseudoduganella ginsengisoli]